MDIETYGALKGKLSRADEAAIAANEAAEAANKAVNDIYHDKNFILSVSQ